jgi:hypothetical protein
MSESKYSKEEMREFAEQLVELDKQSKELNATKKDLKAKLATGMHEMKRRRLNLTGTDNYVAFRKKRGYMSLSKKDDLEAALESALHVWKQSQITGRVLSNDLVQCLQSLTSSALAEHVLEYRSQESWENENLEVLKSKKKQRDDDDVSELDDEYELPEITDQKVRARAEHTRRPNM